MSFLSYMVYGWILYRVMIYLLRVVTGQGRYTPHLRSNPYRGAKVLRAIYYVAREVAHADGEETEHERQMVVTMVRQAFGNMSEEQIISEYHRFATTPLTDEDIDDLSLNYRRIVFICAINVAMSDQKLTGSEMVKLRFIAARLKLPKEMQAEFFSQLEASTGRGKREFQGKQVSAREFAYSVLGVTPESSQREIKKAYQRLAMKNHPDRLPAAEKEKATERFKEIGDAYKILSDS